MEPPGDGSYQTIHSVSPHGPRQRAYFKSVTILVPQWWNLAAESATAETLELADVRVAPTNPVYGDNPYTVQVGMGWSIARHRTGSAESPGTSPTSPHGLSTSTPAMPARGLGGPIR